MNKVAKIKVENDLKESILKVVNEIGGFESFIKKGDVVLLKPNFNTADPSPASTSIDFLKAITELVYDCGAKMVIIGDSSTMSLNSRKVMEKIGVFELENMERPPRVYVFDERGWVKKDIPDGKYLKSLFVSEYLDKADKLILLPNLKTHFLSNFTGSLKLSMGFAKPFERVGFHLRNLQEKIAEMNKIIVSDLVIMDARKCFIKKGPAKGDIRSPGLVLASKSRVAIDVEGVKIIQGFKGNSLKGINPLDLPQIKKAIEFGVDN